MRGNGVSVCKRALTVCNCFPNICVRPCTSILAFDLTSCEAISRILLGYSQEFLFCIQMFEIDWFCYCYLADLQAKSIHSDSSAALLMQYLWSGPF
jgi:hypothetical protein